MNNEGSGELFIPIVVIMAAIYGLLYFFGYLDFAQRLIYVYSGFLPLVILLIVGYSKLSKDTNQNPELKDAKESVFLYMFFLIILILIVCGLNLYYLAELRDIFSNIDYIYMISGTSFLYLIFVIYKTTPSSAQNNKIILINQDKSFNLSNYEKFDKNDKSRYVKVGDTKKFTCNKQDIFTEKFDIWELNKSSKIKTVNPRVFSIFNSSVKANKYIPIKATYETIMKDKKYMFYRLLINKLNTNYRSSTSTPIDLETIFQEQGNDLNFVAINLAEKCTYNLSNFALGQLYRYSHINRYRELLSAIVNVSSTQVKTAGIKYYMYYLIHNDKEINKSYKLFKDIKNGN